MASIKVIGQERKPVKVSVVIPTYRRYDQALRALKSALKQGFTSAFEVLVVDNNPERGCELEKTLVQLQEILPPFQYFKNERNLGMTGNWNRCFELALGEWVIMLHDDDLLLESYAKAIEPHLTPKNDVISVQTMKVQEKDLADLAPDDLKHAGIYTYRYTLFDFLFGYRIGAPVGLAVKKDFFWRIDGYNESYYPSIDFEFAVRASTHGRLMKLRGRDLAIYVYGVNETLKLETLKGFIKMNRPIKSIILQNLSLPDGALRFFERYFITYDKEYILNAAKNFGHNLEDVKGLFDEGGVNKLTYNLISRTYQGYFRLKILLAKLELFLNRYVKI